MVISRGGNYTTEVYNTMDLVNHLKSVHPATKHIKFSRKGKMTAKGTSKQLSLEEV